MTLNSGTRCINGACPCPCHQAPLSPLDHRHCDSAIDALRRQLADAQEEIKRLTAVYWEDV
jgi:hypothetical protein